MKTITLVKVLARLAGPVRGVPVHVVCGRCGRSRDRVNRAEANRLGQRRPIRCRTRCGGWMRPNVKELTR